MQRRLILVLMLASLVGGCDSRSLGRGSGAVDQAQASAQAKASAIKVFRVRGKVVGTEGARVVLNHQAVPGLMDAMTMPYGVRDPNVLSELHPGDEITAKILVEEDAGGFRNPVLDEIVVIGRAKPDYRPAVQYHVPQVGERVPNFSMLNENGRTIHLDDFRGKVVLLTFIYTRCPLADYCPRMSRNFAEVDQALAKDPKLYAESHLISVSFDPGYDTPKVLRSYGGAYTGKYTRESFAHWDFAAPTVKEMPTVTQFFDVGVTPGEGRSLTHSLSTVLIGEDGRVLAWYPTNDWKPEEVVAQIRKAAGSGVG